MTLNQLSIGQSAVVTQVGGEGALRQHFLDMGVIPGAEITLVKYAPMGDPMELLLGGYTLTLRVDDAKNIGVEPIPEASLRAPAGPRSRTPHPGLGEGGKYHVKADEHPLPAGTMLTFALAGNQNCGKTTLFNQLTGSSQHVGNFPGVTVDRKDGVIRGHANTLVTDLPGIYSMSPYTGEELVTRQFLLGDKPKGIINIVDATNIERNLYLTLQMAVMGIPMVLALNMMDEVRNNGGSINIAALSDALGIPVVPISAAKNEGVADLISEVVRVARAYSAPTDRLLLRRAAPVHSRHHAPARGPRADAGHHAALCRHQAHRRRSRRDQGAGAERERDGHVRAFHHRDGARDRSGPQRRAG